MYHLRKSEDRGIAEFGWLHARHTFSFGEYLDPQYMSFRSLRVINEDRIEPKEGFPTHGHRDMEIITYIVSGALEHKDSMGNGSIIHPGEIQYMSAGTGVRHSEFNHSQHEITHLLQIWIMPDRSGHTPRYDQKQFSREERLNKLCLAASGGSTSGPISIHQDMKLYSSFLEQGQKIDYSTTPERGLWLQLIQGKINANGHSMSAGDGLAMQEISRVSLLAETDSELLLFDLR